MDRSNTSSAKPRNTRRPSERSKNRGAMSLGEMPLPKFVEPQLATLVIAVPEDSGWLHELKFDGYRLFCRVENSQISVLTRNAQDWTARFGVLAEAAKQLPVRQAIIDGEIVSVDDDGSHSFQRLQNFLRDGAAGRLVYYAFDLLYLDGRDLRAAPLLERKTLLRQLLSRSAKARRANLIRYSEHWIGRGKELLAEACDAGLEGIVAKRVDEPYRSGRGRSWLKIKCSKNQEFVIGGFTDPAGARIGFGALLLGVYDETGALRYAGRVGTGFDDEMLQDLHGRLKRHERRSTPFVGTLRRADCRGVHWVEPKLVGEVAFSGWTSDGLLRHPSFKGLREDKPASEISREVAAPTAVKVSREKFPKSQGRRSRN